MGKARNAHLRGGGDVPKMLIQHKSRVPHHQRLGEGVMCALAPSRELVMEYLRRASVGAAGPSPSELARSAPVYFLYGGGCANSARRRARRLAHVAHFTQISRAEIRGSLIGRRRQWLPAPPPNPLRAIHGTGVRGCVIFGKSTTTRQQIART